MQQNANIKPCRWWSTSESQSTCFAQLKCAAKRRILGAVHASTPLRGENLLRAHLATHGWQMTSRQKESGGSFFSAVVCPCCNSFLPRPRRLRVLPAAFRLPHAAVVVPAGRVQIGAQRERQLPCDSMLKKVFSLMSECVCGKGGGRCWAPLSLPPPPP